MLLLVFFCFLFGVLDCGSWLVPLRHYSSLKFPSFYSPPPSSGAKKRVELIPPKATGLGFVCFVVINPFVLSANRVDLGSFCFINFSILTPPPPPIHPGLQHPIHRQARQFGRGQRTIRWVVLVEDKRPNLRPSGSNGKEGVDIEYYQLFILYKHLRKWVIMLKCLLALILDSNVPPLSHIRFSTCLPPPSLLTKVFETGCSAFWWAFWGCRVAKNRSAELCMSSWGNGEWWKTVSLGLLFGSKKLNFSINSRKLSIINRSCSKRNEAYVITELIDQSSFYGNFGFHTVRKNQ